MQIFHFVSVCQGVLDDKVEVFEIVPEDGVLFVLSRSVAVETFEMETAV